LVQKSYRLLDIAATEIIRVDILDRERRGGELLRETGEPSKRIAALLPITWKDKAVG
jgi:hypothetical protein